MLHVDRDLYLLHPRRTRPRLEKLATMADDLAWHREAHMLLALLDGKLTLWLYPR